MSRKKFLSVQKDSSMNKIRTNQFEIRVGFGDGGGGGMNIRFQNCEKGFDICLYMNDV